MTTQELAILDALNIASTIHCHPTHGYEATAEQIVTVLHTDERIAADYMPALYSLDRRQVTNHLVRLEGRGAKPHPLRAGKGVSEAKPLVQNHRRGYWRLTDHACQLLVA